MRLRIDLAYDGTDFHGWASQPDLRTVQGTLESALATVLRLPEARLVCAGRTDTGVHARGQVAHVDLPEEAYDDQLLRRLNGILPADLRVREVSVAPPGFDARFAATWRRYAYRVADRPGGSDPLTRNHVLWWPRPLDVDAMAEASTPLEGLHDFAAFCKQREGATTIRTLQRLTWEREPGGLVVATVRADAFCHHMVRSLVGALLAVGERRRSVAWPAEVLTAGVRDSAVPVVPAHGLTLEEVGYPAGVDGLRRQAERARAKREA
ncbi:tRNA pseudouridine(38-40) synthase TruA [Nocardioides coralli]|uniref:tRNA pseudouridine(38-40) synthase TruA n=1 Tax=Nocardioides coralli TaxID=2872154 RepID=UPI001CA3ABFF|nr:tRNA pseudouridine(38-40) synthase TruA [Nocardioides coralli]QZY28603.1 tRNA pseudouridine(38-40) synthase TruA [Nocardioides coralli]